MRRMLSTLWRHIKAHPIRTAALFGVVAGAINVLILEAGGIEGRNTNTVLRMLLPSASSDTGPGGVHALQAAFLLLFEVAVNVLTYVLLLVIPVALIVAIRRAWRWGRR